MIDGCHEECELCDIIHLKAILDPIARRDIDCSILSSPSEGTKQFASSSSSTTNNGNNGETSFLSLSTTTGIAIFVTLVVLSGFGGSAVTFAIMRKRYTHIMSHRRMDYGGAWNIDGDDYGVEMREGGVFRDEPSELNLERDGVFVN